MDQNTAPQINSQGQPNLNQPKAGITVKRPPLLWGETQRVVANLEAKLGGRVVTYFVGSGYSIVSDDVKYSYSHLKTIGFQETLYFIIISSGGDGMSAYRIANLLRNYCNKLVIVLPEKAASAATMLSLAGDEIYMSPLAYLTAVDTSLNHPLNPKGNNNNPVSVELEEVKQAVNAMINGNENPNMLDIYKTLFTYVNPVAYGAMKRSTNLSEKLCRDILELRKDPVYPEELKRDIINKLNNGYPTHAYPIPREKARELGLNVKKTTPELDNILWDLLNLYRFMSEPVRTDLSENFIHTEQQVKFIESVGARLMVESTYERKLDPILKAWNTFKDEFKWVSAYEELVEGQKKLRLSYLNF